ncbi:hypothetical protein YC2023_051525 [Brassica napus]
MVLHLMSKVFKKYNEASLWRIYSKAIEIRVWIRSLLNPYDKMRPPCLLHGTSTSLEKNFKEMSRDASTIFWQGLQLQKMLKSQRTRFTTTTSTHEKQDRKLEGCIAARHQPLELRRPDT